MKIFDKYVQSLQKFNINDVTEHTYRNELQELLEGIAKSCNKKISIIHEPKRQQGFGAPDFKIKTDGEAILGYVENKKLTENLSNTIKSAQIKKYLSLSDNIILTNYIEWYWFKNGEFIDNASLCELSDLDNPITFVLETSKVYAVNKLIENFYSQAPKGIGKPKQLAEALAIRARYLRDFLDLELKRQEYEDQEGRLYGLYDTFKTNIFHDLTRKEFSDAFSQTLVYGLFLSKLNAGNKIIDLYNAKQFILPAFGLISELVDFLDVLDHEYYKDARWIVEEILSVMNTINMHGIIRNLSYNKFKSTNLFNEDSISYNDPYIYFYEHFLAAYDRALRKSAGVYYTPPQIVHFIVRSVNFILKEIYNIDNGYADKDRVTVLDFATGTGSFLLEVLEAVLEEIPNDSGKKNLIISDHILKNMYGFEYMIAPYAVANLKLSQFLKEQGYELKKNDRFQIYLTNTLEPVDPQIRMPLLPTLTKEAKAAQRVKDNPVFIITGNPPYSGHSRNPSEKVVRVRNKKGKFVNQKVKTWIGNLIDDYRFVDGVPLGERNSKWLQDDYVKFFRFAQWKIDQVEDGVVGVITNHRFISNPTFRGLRKSLMNSFNQIYILDLHGSFKPKEHSPDGGVDENVFDIIQQGVAITFLIKKPGLENKVFHSDLFGSRDDKYDFCLRENFASVEWNEIIPEYPDYYFLELDKSNKAFYDTGTPIKEIFEKDIIGFYTGRDSTAIAHDIDALKYQLYDYNPNYKFDHRHVKKCLYKPLDYRFVYYSNDIVKRIRKKIMPSMLQPNISLTVGRAGSAVSKEFMWNLAFVSDTIIDLNLFYRGGANIFPLYLYEDESNVPNQHELAINKSICKRTNLTKSFQDLIKTKYTTTPSEQEIMGYLYAILYSPTYRNKYQAFLDRDFPKIPLVDSIELFLKLAKVGLSLIDSHLMKKNLSKSDYPLGDFKGNGNYIVTKRNYIVTEYVGKLYINKTQYFDNVPKSVYEFYIGGYQVLDKYLKDRRNRRLDLSDVDNIEKIIRILQFTIDKMNEIDELTKEWI